MERHEWREDRPGMRVAAQIEYAATPGELFFREPGEEKWHRAHMNPSARTLSREVLRLAAERARVRRELLSRLTEARTHGPGEGGFITSEGYRKGVEMAMSLLIAVCPEEV